MKASLLSALEFSFLIPASCQATETVTKGTANTLVDAGSSHLNTTRGVVKDVGKTTEMPPRGRNHDATQIASDRTIPIVPSWIEWLHPENGDAVAMPHPHPAAA